MANPPPYGVLLVTGLRTHQENYAPMFAADPRCRLVALADEAEVPPQRAEWNRELARRLELPYIENLEQALARDDVHIASICSEHERRGRVADTRSLERTCCGGGWFAEGPIRQGTGTRGSCPAVRSRAYRSPILTQGPATARRSDDRDRPA